MKAVKVSIRVLFYVASFTAAILWFRAAFVPVPVPTWNGVGPGGDFLEALNRSAHLNGWAAITTGVSVLLSAVREWIHK